MKNFIGIYDGLLSTEFCLDIIRHFENSPNKKQGISYTADNGVERPPGVDVSIKDSTDLYCSFADQSVPLYGKILESLQVATKKYREEHYECDEISPWCVVNDFNIQRYLPNQGYHHIHCESGSKSTNDRVLAWMIYLNTVTDGGQTRFPSYDFDVTATLGRLVIWPAFFTHLHHGIISSTQIKYIATGWYAYR